MALLSYALTNLDRQKEFLGITTNDYNTILTSLINTTTEFVENYCDRRFKRTTYTNEVYDGTGSNQLLLNQYPATTFTSLEQRNSTQNISSWTAFSSNDYFVKENEGIIVLVSGLNTMWQSGDSGMFIKLPQHYRATYIAGYNFDASGGTYLEDVGLGDLEYVVWKLTATAFNQRKGSDDVQSERIGEYSVTYRKEVAMDTELKQILETYRRNPPF